MSEASLLSLSLSFFFFVPFACSASCAFTSLLLKMKFALASALLAVLPALCSATYFTNPTASTVWSSPEGETISEYSLARLQSTTDLLSDSLEVSSRRCSRGNYRSRDRGCKPKVSLPSASWSLRIMLTIPFSEPSSRPSSPTRLT